ncbi:MAG: hypothetical protein JW727_06595 [Candidatus Aenigmarchaeota archaeon]|nr:hypothetical protein [Candidatus Aenigmarchaeota archaeon]
MGFRYLNLSSEEKYALVGKLIEELKLRKYSYQTGQAYIKIVRRFLSSNKTPREFLLALTERSNSTMRLNYFALKFLFENVFREKFFEKLTLAKPSQKLPVVLSREEVARMHASETNLKHKLVLALLYYAGLRLNEASACVGKTLILTGI